MSDREAIFISHATPEDNQFTIWLGAKLTAMGYEVWADVLKLRGGHDWQRRLEAALRDRALKVLLVANPISVDKQGVRNEIQIASEVARSLKDDAFIIPLRLSPYQSPFLVAQAQYIPFDNGWAAGFRDLIAALEEYGVPHNQRANTDAWRELQTIHARSLSATPETLVSNWVEVSRLPPWIYFHSEDYSSKEHETYSRISYGNGHFSFAGVPPKRRRQSSTAKKLDAFLAEGWNALAIPKQEGRKLITQLINLSLEDYLKRRGLGTYMMANRHEAFWVAKSAPLNKVSFDWNLYRGSRLLQGRSLKRGVHWHFAVSPSYQAFPTRHICFRGRLIFTADGDAPIQSSAKMHKLRRSFAKGWRNARWRDMLLAFLYWLSQGTSTLSIPAGPSESIDLRLPPIFYRSPVGIPATNDDQEPDDDDPTPDLGSEMFDEDTEDADSEEI